MKRKVSVTIDQKIYEKAHSLGVNVSKASENALLAIIDAIEQANGSNNLFSRGFSAEKSRMVRSPGFEPGSSAWQGPTQVDWKAFEEFLKGKKYRGSGYRSKLSYAVRYHGLLFRGELGKLSELSGSARSQALKALAVLCEFLGCKNLFKKEKERFNLKWTAESADRTFIKRFTRSENPDDVLGWIRSAKKAKPDLAVFLDFMAVTGLRRVEAVEAYNLIIQLSNTGKLGEYYNSEKSALEHYKWEKRFLRKSKKAYVSFVPADLVEAVGGGWLLASPEAVSSSLRKAGVKPRFADIREAHGTLMLKFLNTTEINFLHGRVTGGVFEQHYFNPALISDLRERSFKGIEEIQEKIKT